MKFIVTEIQKFDTGAITTPSYAYDDRNMAESAYHTILAAAAVSNVPVHAAIMFTEEGTPIMNKAFMHYPEPEIEPEESETE